MRTPRVAVSALAIGLLLSGCIFSGGPDNVRSVCERKAGAPGHPYPPDVVEGLTAVDAGLTDGQRYQAFLLLADRLLTPGGSPYVTFSGTLANDSASGVWVFDARGGWEGGEDRYLILLDMEGGAARITDERPGISAPERLVERAEAVLAADTDAQDLVADKTERADARWYAGAPSCVDLVRGCVGCVASHVWVNIVRGQVVLVTEEAIHPTEG